MSLDFKKYSQQAAQFTSHTGDASYTPVYVMGLCGEAGEVAEKFKKFYRDDVRVASPEFKEEVAKELGDVLWYVNALACDLGLELDDIAEKNIQKLVSRTERGMMAGSGDNR